MKSFKESGVFYSKTAARKAVDSSRKYLSLTQTQARDWMQATGKKLSAGRQWLPKTLRRRFLDGLKLIIPLGVTILILVWVFDKVDGILQPVIRAIFGHNVPGVGLVVTILLILIVGVIVGSVAGRKLIHYGESILSKIPLVCQLYYSIKQIVESFSSQDKGSFMRVVMIEFPKEGMKTVAFVTNEYADQSGKQMLNVFIPTAPNPTSGFLQIVAEEDVTPTDISIDDALKMVMSAGKVSAKGVTDGFGGDQPEKSTGPTS